MPTPGLAPNRTNIDSLQVFERELLQVSLYRLPVGIFCTERGGNLLVAIRYRQRGSGLGHRFI